MREGECSLVGTCVFSGLWGPTGPTIARDRSQACQFALAISRLNTMFAFYNMTNDGNTNDYDPFHYSCST